MDDGNPTNVCIYLSFSLSEKNRLALLLPHWTKLAVPPEGVLWHRGIPFPGEIHRRLGCVPVPQTLFILRVEVEGTPR